MLKIEEKWQRDVEQVRVGMVNTKKDLELVREMVAHTQNKKVIELSIVLFNLNGDAEQGHRT